MSHAKIDQVAHAYFYAQPGEFNTIPNNLHYRGEKVYSYQTLIGIRTGDLFILSNRYYSNTTSAHQNALRRAMAPNYSRVYVYLKELNLSSLVSDLMACCLECYNSDEKNWHVQFGRNLEALEILAASKRPKFKVPLGKLKALRAIGEQIVTKGGLKGIKAILEERKVKLQRAKVRAEKKRLAGVAAVTKRMLATGIPKNMVYLCCGNIHSTIRQKYDTIPGDLRHTLHDSSSAVAATIRDIRQHLVTINGTPYDTLALSFNDSVEPPEVFVAASSAVVTPRIARLKVLLELWRDDKLTIGSEVGKYTVVKVTPDYVQVGCQKYHTSTLNALIDQLTALDSGEGYSYPTPEMDLKVAQIFVDTYYPGGLKLK